MSPPHCTHLSGSYIRRACNSFCGKGNAFYKTQISIEATHLLKSENIPGLIQSTILHLYRHVSAIVSFIILKTEEHELTCIPASFHFWSEVT